MRTLVIDASVAAKWFLPGAAEPNRAEALALLQRYVTGELRFVVPDLFWAELGNVFWKAAQRGRWPASDAQTALRALLERNFPTVSSHSLLEDAFNISTAYDRSIYDAIYVALALTSKTDLVTADARLANVLAAHLPVKWLGIVGLDFQFVIPKSPQPCHPEVAAFSPAGRGISHPKNIAKTASF